MILTSVFVFFVSCLDACLDAVGVRPPLDCSATVTGIRLFIDAIFSAQDMVG
jgi:hypothetical protein